MLRSITIAVLIACASMAQAQPTDTVLGVKHADLDLTTEDGAARMLNRLDYAAFKSCKKQPMGTDVQRRCIAETLSKSVAALNAPLVSKAYVKSRY